MEPTSGQVILITGGSSGIGLAAARALRPDNTVIITGRSAQTTRLAQELGCDAFLADFGKLADVHSLAEAVLKKYRRIDVLVNNVGGIMGPKEFTDDGHERTLQVNHLAPFLLTKLLQPCLEASQGVVINTSSAAHWLGRVKPKALDDARHYGAMRAYATAKLLNILHAVEINRRFAGVRAVSFHPGPVATGFARAGHAWVKVLYETPLKNLFLITPERGADTLLWLIQTANEGNAWQPGNYYVQRKPGLRSSQARDAALAKAAWEASDKLLKLAPAPTLRSVPRPL